MLLFKSDVYHRQDDKRFTSHQAGSSAGRYLGLCSIPVPVTPPTSNPTSASLPTVHKQSPTETEKA
ncbi:hypothetical protein PSTT_14143 [Puccinia striiformis]|uniref:Uncharacterized protein n=1 Tax=Puccinia striiformis TaxID=27350 RepID=A0A2S4UNU0_9BASI|nr:hypothetical protein PSTT_14143 [Puccinia striiformis]